MEAAAETYRPVNRRTTSCQTCHRRKVACDLGAPCSACKKHALTLKKDPMSMVCIYPCSPNELQIRRASYDDRLLAQRTEDEELGLRRRRTRSATALEGGLDEISLQEEPKRGSGGSPSSSKSAEVKLKLKLKPKRRQSKEQKVKVPVVEEPVEEDVEMSNREHTTSSTEQEPEHFIHSPILPPIGHHFPIFNNTPIYTTHTPMPSTFVYHDPFAEPASVPAFADPLPPAFITIFGSGTSTHSPIRSITPVDALLPCPLPSNGSSDSGSDEMLGVGFLSDSSPSSSTTNFTSPYEEYIAIVDDGYFAKWE